MGPFFLNGLFPWTRRIGFLLTAAGFCALVVLSAVLPLRAAEADGEELKEAEAVLNDAKIATDGPSLLAYIKKRTVPETDRAKLAALVRKLGDDEFQVRKKAFAELQAAGQAAEAVLREALKDEDPEIATSAAALLEKMESGSASAIMAAAARVLADRKPAGTVPVLLAYLPLAANDDQVQESFRKALLAAGLKGGQPDDALVRRYGEPRPRSFSARPETSNRQLSAGCSKTPTTRCVFWPPLP
jgi:hypothetical protein